MLYVPPGRECRRTVAGTDYLGTQDVTRSGARCLPWNQDQVKDFTGQDTYILDSNYCRNYRFDRGLTSPWCFTSQSSWEFCDIDVCGELHDDKYSFLYCS